MVVTGEGLGGSLSFVVGEFHFHLSFTLSFVVGEFHFHLLLGRDCRGHDLYA